MKRLFFLFCMLLLTGMILCGCSAVPVEDPVEKPSQITADFSAPTSAEPIPETTPSFTESADPPSPEEVAAEIRDFIPQELPFDPTEYPLLETPPTQTELLGDFPPTFVFEEENWTFVEETDEQKHYINDEKLHLFLVKDGSAYICDENRDAIYLSYDTEKNVSYFKSYDASYDPYICYTQDEEGNEISYSGTNTMIRKGNVRYYHERKDDGALLSVRIVDEEKKDGWIITRSYTIEPAAGGIQYSCIDISREDGSPHGFSADYNADGKVWADIFYIYDSEDGEEFGYIFDKNYTFISKEPLVQE